MIIMTLLIQPNFLKKQGLFNYNIVMKEEIIMIFFEDELIVNNRSCDNDNCDCDASGSCTCASDECDSGGGNIFDDEDD